MCYDNIVEGIVDDDVDRVVELLEKNTNEMKKIMTNFKVYFLFYKTKSKEMVLALLDYFDVKSIFDIAFILTSIINVAIMHGMDIEMIKRLIDRGGSINDKDVRNVSPLLQSIISKRDINFVKEILDMGADVNEICNRFRNTILHLAVSNCCNGDDVEIIKLLIDSGANINAESCSDRPLMKLPLDADEDLWLELVKRRPYIDEENAKYSFRENFLSTVLTKKSRIDQFIDLLIDNRFSVDAINKVCNHLLYFALKNNCSVDYIIEIIDKGADVNEMKYLNKYNNDYSTTPLIMALQLKRDKEIISVLINSRANVNAVNEHGVTPLVCAINNNYKVEVIDKLISLGADINKCDFDGVSPLMYAIKKNDKEITSRLINAEADINAVDMFGRTSLYYAVVYSDDDYVINLLIKKGADFSEINNRYDQFWFSLEAMKKSDDEFIISIVNRNDLNIKDGFGQTFLMYALELNMKKNIIFKIIRNGADINAIDYRGYTPLIYAIKYECDVDVIINLIEHGADVKVIDNNGLTPIKHAVHSSMFKEIIQILIDNGVNINSPDENNSTVLLYILKNVNNNKELVSFAIQKGAEVNICDNKGLTPLMYTVLYCVEAVKTEIVSMLIESGACIDAVDVDGHTALYYAFSCEDYTNENTLRSLLDYGASVRKSVEYLCEGETPLKNAVSHDRDVKIVIELLNCKEDINEVTTSGHSFLSYVYVYHKELALLLISDHNYILKNDTELVKTIFRNASDIFIKKLLFCCGVDVNYLDNNFRTPLMYVVDGMRGIKLIKEILENGGNAKSVDQELNTPLHYCTSPKIINLLIVYGNADITARNNSEQIMCWKVLHNSELYYRKRVQPIIKHLLLVSPEEINMFRSLETYYSGFIKGCIAELKKMLTINIVNNLSFFKFCCELSEQDMNLISESDNFCIYNDKKIKQLFPIYFNIISMKIKKCKIDLSKRQLINALEKLIIINKVNKSYDPKKCEADLNNCIVEHSDQYFECVYLNYDIIYCISNYLCDRHIVNLLLASL